MYKNPDGCLPLHSAAKHENTDAIEVLASAYPEAITEMDNVGKTPLHHIACKAPRSVIDLMLSLAPDAARVKDYDGTLPLHNAIENNNLDAVGLLLDVYPEAIPEDIGLHFAASMACRFVIARMLSAFPDAVYTKNPYGNLPLHIAFLYDNADAIEFLVNAYPEAVLEKNFDGTTPLHYFIANKAKNDGCLNVSHVDILKLIRKFPQAIFMTAEHGIFDMDDIKSLVVEWSYQALQR